MFYRYPSINNLRCMTPLTSDVRVFASEKIDGANLGVFIPRNGKCEFYSRSGLPASGLHNFDQSVETLNNFTKHIQESFNVFAKGDLNAIGIYLWGEYFSGSIGKRVSYENYGQFKFYNSAIVRENKELTHFTPMEFNHLFFENESEEFTQFIHPSFEVEGIKNKSDVERVLQLPVRSKFVPNEATEKVNAEGYVVSIVYPNGFIDKYKHKDKNFSDKMNASRPHNSPRSSNPLHEEFLSYINKNRALDVISKTTVRDPKILIGLLVKDAKEDFFKSHPETQEMDKKDLKNIFNAGGNPYFAICEALDSLE